MSSISLERIRAVKRGRWSDEEIQRAFDSRERCNLCPHHASDPETGVIKVSSRGAKEPKLLVVGEAPGIEESQYDQAFVGKAARHLLELFEQTKIEPEAVRFSNATRCFPHNEDLSPKTPSFRDAAVCVPYLYAEIERTRPIVIATVGDFATRVLLGDVPSISRINGKLFYLKLGGVKYPVVPCVHPSANLHAGGRFTNQIVNALSFAWGLIDHKDVPVTSNVINNTTEALDYLHSLLDQYDRGDITKIAYDLEWASVISLSGKKQRSEADRESTLDLYNPEIKLVAASFSSGMTEGYTIILDHVEAQTNYNKLIRGMREVVSTIPCIVHGYSRAEGPWTRTRVGCEVNVCDDTMLKSYAAFMQTRAHGLKIQANHLLDWSDWSIAGDAWFNEQKDESKRSFKYMPLDLMARYASIDPCATWGIDVELSKILDELDLWGTYRRRMALAPILQKWEQRGAVVDMKTLERLKPEYRERTAKHLKKIRSFREVKRFERDREIEFNPNSDQQVADILFGYFGAPLGRTNPKLKRGQDASVVIHADLKAGATEIPVLANMKPAKTIWIGRMSGDTTAERAAIKQLTPTGLELKKPLWRDHKSPVTLVRGTPATDEKEMFRILRRAICPTCKNDVNVRRDCRDCDGYGVREDQQDIHDFTRELRLYNRIQTSIASYLGADDTGISGHLIPNTDRLTFDYLLHSTATARLSVKNMNVHSFPYESDIRRLLVSEWRSAGGLILAADYSQLEVRVLACVSDDETLCRAYLLCPKCNKVGDVSTKGRCPKCNSRLGTDLHRVTAAVLFGKAEKDVTNVERSMAKSTVFGLIYGRGAQGIAEETGISRADAQEIIDKFFDRFPGVYAYVSKMHKICAEKGEFRGITGTLLHFPGWDSSDDGRFAEAERYSQNYPVQGPAGEVMIDGIIELDKRIEKKRLRSQMWETTHDSLSFDIYPGEFFETSHLARKVLEDYVMQQHPWLTVPLLTDQVIGVRWDGALAIEDMDGDQLQLKGAREFYEELIPAFEKSYTVRAKIIKEWDEPHKDEVFNTKGYAGGSGRVDHVVAEVRLS